MLFLCALSVWILTLRQYNLLKPIRYFWTLHGLIKRNCARQNRDNRVITVANHSARGSRGLGVRFPVGTRFSPEICKFLSFRSLCDVVSSHLLLFGLY